MKFGFRTGGFINWSIEDILEKLSEIGFDGAELCLEATDMRPENFTIEKAKKLRDFMDKLNIEIASVSYHADAEPLEQRRINTLKAVDIANWLGAEILIINSERLIESEKQKQWDELVLRLIELTNYAKKLKVNIAIEPEPLLIISDTNDMIRMINEIDSPNLKVNLDIGHAYITDNDLSESINKLGKAIIHTHIEDIKDKVHNHLVPGAGDINFESVKLAFDKIKYDGYYVIDLFRLGDDPLRLAESSLKALREKFL